VFAEKNKREDTDNGLFVDNNFGDDFEDEYEDDFDDDNKKSAKKQEEDIFNNSRTKDKSEPALNKQNPSKEEPKKGESSTSEKKDISATGKLQVTDEEEEEELDPEDQAKMINDQFNYIYENDPQLKQVLGNEISGLSLEEKYQIMNAYMNGGGV